MSQYSSDSNSIASDISQYSEELQEFIRGTEDIVDGMRQDFQGILSM